MLCTVFNINNFSDMLPLRVNFVDIDFPEQV